MKTLQQIIKQDIEQEWEVPSESEKGTVHTVSLLKNGTWKCGCPALKNCKHIDKIKFFYERNQIRFDGYNPILKFLRVDKSVRVEIDTSLDQYEQVKNIPLLPEGVYEITIRPKTEK